MAHLLQRRAFALCLATGALPALGVNEAMSTPALWKALRSGGHVLLIRHAFAPGTFDPPGFKLDDCSTQRNLSEEGRQQARRLGELLRSRQVLIGQVLSSQWCRCIDTAQLAFGSDKVTPQASLSSPTQSSPEQRIRNTEAVRQQINTYAASNSGRAANLVMVTHMFNIQDITGEGVAEGEILIVKGLGTDSKLAPRVLGRIATA